MYNTHTFHAPTRLKANWSRRELMIHNLAQMLINRYEDKGVVGANRFFEVYIKNHPDRALIEERVKVINGYQND